MKQRKAKNKKSEDSRSNDPSRRKVIAVIIPTYNERENMERLVSRIYDILSNVYILVVDDSPNDETLREVKRLSKIHPRLSILSRHKKGGRGSAVLAGFSYARKH